MPFVVATAEPILEPTTLVDGMIDGQSGLLPQSPGNRRRTTGHMAWDGRSIGSKAHGRIEVP